jgi:hypothetical protein
MACGVGIDAARRGACRNIKGDAGGKLAINTVN